MHYFRANSILKCFSVGFGINVTIPARIGSLANAPDPCNEISTKVTDAYDGLGLTDRPQFKKVLDITTNL